MSKLAESYRGIRERGQWTVRNITSRINPEGLALSGISAAIATAINTPVQLGLRSGMQELSQIVEADLNKIIVVGVIALVNTISIATETKTLKDKEFSSGVFPNIMHTFTGDPLKSSVGAHALNYGIATSLNPLTAVAIVTGDNQLLNDALLTSMVAVPAWRTMTNAFILHGETDPVVNAGIEGRRIIGHKLEPLTRPMRKGVEYVLFKKNRASRKEIIPEENVEVSQDERLEPAVTR